VVAAGALEALQELLEDLFLGLLLLDHFGVLGGIKDALQVLGVDLARAVYVHDREAALDHGCPAFVEWVAQLAHELGLVHVAVVVDVELLEERLCLSLGKRDARVLQQSAELGFLQ